MKSSFFALKRWHGASDFFVGFIRFWRVLVGGLACFAVGASIFGKVNLGEGPDRRLLQIGDLVGTEALNEFEETATGGLKVEYETKRVVFDAAGEPLVEFGMEEVYSPATDVLVDFSVKGEISVRRGSTGELLGEHDFPENDAVVLNAFFTDAGRICHAEVSYKKVVSFDPMTGEALRVDENFYSWEAVSDGPLMARFTFFSYPEAPAPPSWPVQESLYDSRSGERLFEEGLVGEGWLYRGPLAGRQAFFVTNQIRVVDTQDASFTSLGLDGGVVVNRFLAPSRGSGRIVALARFEEAAYRLGIWEVETGEVTWVDWDEAWGSVLELRDFAVAESGEFLILAMSEARVFRVDVDTGLSARILEDETKTLKAVAVLKEDSRLLTLDIDSVLRVFDVDTGGELFSVDLLQPEVGDDWKLSSEGDVLFVGTDARVRRLDLGTSEAFVMAPKESPRVTAVLPENEEGLVAVLFADGTLQDLDVATGEAMGGRRLALPEHDSVLESDVDARLAVLDGGRVFDVDTGVLLFDLAATLDRDELMESERQVIANLLESQSLRAKLLGEGSRVAFFDGEWAAVFTLANSSLIDASERAWVELVEGEAFLVALEKAFPGAETWVQRLGVYDAVSYEELYRVAVRGDVVVSDVGDSFAWMEENVNLSEGTPDVYYSQFVVRQFALEEMGFGEVDAMEWTESISAGEVPGYGTPSLLRYEGPDGPALALVGLERVLELPTGGLVEWDRPRYRDGRGTRVVQETAGGGLLLWDELGRVGVYGYFVPRVRAVDLVIGEGGWVEPDLSDFPADRIDVWTSVDLKVWQPWVGRPVLVLSESSIFFRVIEWVPE